MKCNQPSSQNSAPIIRSTMIDDVIYIIAPNRLYKTFLNIGRPIINQVNVSEGGKIGEKDLVWSGEFGISAILIISPHSIVILHRFYDRKVINTLENIGLSRAFDSATVI